MFPMAARPRAATAVAFFVVTHDANGSHVRTLKNAEARHGRRHAAP